MSGGGKGGSQTTTSEVSIPDWAEDAAKSNLARADDISKIGYVPYYGPDVAAFTPQQEAAFNNTNSLASAFGMGSAPVSTMQPVQTYAGGVRGYSSAPLYQGALDQLKENAPGQYDFITGMFIDPVTGASAQNASAGQPEAAPQQKTDQRGGFEDIGMRIALRQMQGMSVAEALAAERS